MRRKERGREEMKEAKDRMCAVIVKELREQKIRKKKEKGENCHAERLLRRKEIKQGRRQKGHMCRNF